MTDLLTRVKCRATSVAKNHLDCGSLYIRVGWMGGSTFVSFPISCIFTPRVFHGAKCLNVELKLRKVMLWILDWVTLTWLRIYDWTKNTDIQTNNEQCHCDTIEYWFYLDSNYVFDATLKQSPWEYISADSGNSIFLILVSSWVSNVTLILVYY